MSELIQSDDFKSIVLNKTALIDVRAPVEFNKGAFPYALNLPIMSDEERHLVGICYKEKGNEQAIKLGHTLVSGDVKKNRVQAWNDFIQASPDAKLYCFRGGQRSKISQVWLSEAEKNIVRLRGGYKAFRNFLLESIEEAPKHFKPIILGGRTGSGKTILLKKLQNAIDLEGLANHRGSSFGRKLTQQPTQINFENALAYELIEKIDKGFSHLIFEDEGSNVGSIYMPKNFVNFLSQAPLIILQTPTKERVEITFEEYVVDAQARYLDAGKSCVGWRDDIKNAMKRIAKRLGSQRYKEVTDIFDDAFGIQERDGSLEAYKPWVEYLLREYYDPMYDYQIEKRSEYVLFRGSPEEVENYLRPKNL